jgi:ACT domain-containing protein
MVDYSTAVRGLHPRCSGFCTRIFRFAVSKRAGTVGVIAKVSAVCAELNINIEDVSQSILQQMFCMIMLVDLSACSAGQDAVHNRFAALGKEMNMQVTLTREEVFDAMHTI